MPYGAGVDVGSTQTKAVIMDEQGRVVGVNAQIESESGGNDGVGFAIPSNTARSIVSQLLESGEVAHAYLGITMVTIPSGVAEQLDLVAGVEVTDVRSGTPAAQAELEAATGTTTVSGQEYPTGGDVIVAFDGPPCHVRMLYTPLSTLLKRPPGLTTSFLPLNLVVL